jgi:mannose-6-phosphate isomerase-like protein (cupin superfamily)
MSLLNNRDHEERPWGTFTRFTENELSTVKILHINANMRLSLQKHANRSEFWRVIEGTGVAEIGGIPHDLVAGNEIEIPVGTLHRLAAGPHGIRVLEIALGEFDEKDIERVSDDFGRVAAA